MRVRVEPTRRAARWRRLSGGTPRGFTLVELLVAISVFLIVTAMAVAVVNGALTGDRLSGAARQVQSYVGGARDRAIYTVRTEEGPRNRGVRFLRDPDLPFAVTSMVYVESSGAFPSARLRRSSGRLQFRHAQRGVVQDLRTSRLTLAANSQTLHTDYILDGVPDAVADEWTGNASRPEHQLNRLLKTGQFGRAELATPGGWRFYARIKLDQTEAGDWLTLEVTPNNPGAAKSAVARLSGISTVQLTKAVSDSARDAFNFGPNNTFATPRGSSISPEIEFTLDEFVPGALFLVDLEPVPLPGEEPRALPGGTAIDLTAAYAHGTLPGEWYTPPMGGESTGLLNRYRDPITFSPQMDLMFSPRGSVTGSLARFGYIHLPLVSLDDLDDGLEARWAAAKSVPLFDDMAEGDFLPFGFVGDGDPDGEFPSIAGRELVMSISTQTGRVATSPVDATDDRQLDGTSGADGLADDPFALAELGVEVR